MPKPTSADIEAEPASDTVDEVVTQPTMADLFDLIQSQNDKITKLELSAKVRSVRAPAGLPEAPTTAQIMKRLKKGEAAGGTERVDQTGLRPAFQINDIVALTNEAKLEVLQSKGKVVEGEDLLGVVKSRMYRRRRDNQMKYKVDFPGIGEDGAMEDELRLVEAAY